MMVTHNLLVCGALTRLGSGRLQWQAISEASLVACVVENMWTVHRFNLRRREHDMYMTSFGRSLPVRSPWWTVVCYRRAKRALQDLYYIPSTIDPNSNQHLTSNLSLTSLVVVGNIQIRRCDFANSKRRVFRWFAQQCSIVVIFIRSWASFHTSVAVLAFAPETIAVFLS